MFSLFEHFHFSLFIYQHKLTLRHRRRSLHWLPGSQRTDFKVLLLRFKSLNGAAS